MSLSERLRPEVECAPWVITEVKRMETYIKRLKTQLKHVKGEYKYLQYCVDRDEREELRKCNEQKQAVGP